MTRRAAAVLLVLTLFPAVLYAQDTALTVTVQSADVYKGPSTGTPVIGHAPKGDVLPVVRNLGSWVQVAWVAAPDGIGYVHTTMGRLNIPNASSPATTATTSSRALSSPAPASTPAPVPLSTAQRTPASAGDRLPPSGQSGGSPISHIVGVGGMVGTMSSFGATARWWRNKHVGVQVGLTRDAMSSDTAAGRVTSMQIEPGVVYALFDRVPGYLWIRPYVGSALSFRHQTWKDTAPCRWSLRRTMVLISAVRWHRTGLFASVTQFD
jgi:hypothetical protein